MGQNSSSEQSSEECNSGCNYATVEDSPVEDSPVESTESTESTESSDESTSDHRSWNLCWCDVVEEDEAVTSSE
jgi:hypothetical protein